MRKIKRYWIIIKIKINHLIYAKNISMYIRPFHGNNTGANMCNKNILSPVGKTNFREISLIRTFVGS